MPLGPRKGTSVPAAPRLSGARAAVLDAVRAQPRPITLAALGSATGLHANTLREHLAGLEEHGLVRRERATPRGRGRPASLYVAADPDEQSEYAGLVATLAAAIHHTSSNPRDAAVAAGRAWGRELAREKGGPSAPSRPAARRQVIELLSDLGFAPQTDDRNSLAMLTRCPLLGAARRDPDVVCGVHLGIVRGALDEYGGDPERTELFPFSDPGACRLELLFRQPDEGSRDRRHRPRRRPGAHDR
jgi:predicted ArsR family transcriptional regulator